MKKTLTCLFLFLAVLLLSESVFADTKNYLVPTDAGIIYAVALKPDGAGQDCFFEIHWGVWNDGKTITCDSNCKGVVLGFRNNGSTSSVNFTLTATWPITYFSQGNPPPELQDVAFVKQTF